jgi:hypothetical protein
MREHGHYFIVRPAGNNNMQWVRDALEGHEVCSEGWTVYVYIDDAVRMRRLRSKATGEKFEIIPIKIEFLEYVIEPDRDIGRGYYEGDKRPN